MANAKMISTRVREQVFRLGLAVGLLTGLCFAQPNVGLTHASGPPTTKLAVSGKGFAANAVIDIYFDTADLAVAVSNNTGSFSFIQIQVPASALPGKHWITAVTRSNGTAVQKPFTVRTNWAQLGFTSSGKRFNRFENVLSPATVGTIDLHWSFKTGGPGFSSPAEANGVVYVGSEDNKVYALNASTGALRWSFTTGSFVDSSPAVANGVVYVGSDKVYALKASTGAKLWTFPAGFGSSPAVANGVVYVGSDNVYALNASTGALVWTSTQGDFDQFGGSPAVAKGVVYISNEDGNVYALNASTGALLWTFFEGLGASHAVANGVVYVGSDDHNVYALNASTGAKLWSFTTGNAVYSSPAVANGVVYVGSEDNKVYALNASTGAKLWSFVTGSRVASSPAVANGVVYVGSENGNVYAFDQTGGALVRPTADRPNPSTLRPNLNLRVSEPGATALGTGSND